jgi:asparagine synthase (glutamine-hydrolysing)
MCGIAGYAGFSDEKLLHRMCGSLSHRGPDEDGYYLASDVGLSNRRLSVIDLETGQQPLANESRDVWVVFNGEIYNYEDIRKKLLQNGHKFCTRSDTETIVHLYEDFELGFLEHLRGMFAIALWDGRRRRLVLARDRMGEKPLFYATRDQHLYFGSEIKAILQAWGRRSVDAQAVCEFLAAGYVAGERTFFQDISKLPPGHMLVWENNKATVTRYWDPEIAGRNHSSFGAATHELSEHLSETVRLCLKSDVEVGAFLSGGIDSSVLVALMKRHSARIQTFSVGYSGEALGFNELNYAKIVANHVGTQHHELILNATSSVELLPKILWHYDEPHGEPTSVLVYLLCEFTRRFVKVAVGGTGGDEIFFGYPRHSGVRFLEFYRRIPRVFRKRLLERLISTWPESTQGSRFAKRAKRFVSGCDLPPNEAYLTWVRLISPSLHDQLLSERTREAAGHPSGDAFLMQKLAGNGRTALLDKIVALDLEGYLPEYQLAYIDRMSMAHGLEVRSPFCDYKLVKYVTSLPHEYRLKGLRSKHILKAVAKKLIPSRIAERKKVGFDSPIGQWFKGELRPFLQSFLSKDHLKKSGMLDPDCVQSIMADHLAARRDYSLQLWSVIALEGWFRMYVEDQVSEGLSYRFMDLRGAFVRKGL